MEIVEEISQILRDNRIYPPQIVEAVEKNVNTICVYSCGPTILKYLKKSRIDILEDMTNLLIERKY